MIQDIQRHIELANNSMEWAKEFGKDTFPYDNFRNYRRRLRKIYAALSENCSVAAYGESQVGKSYLMSGLLSSPDAPFVIAHEGKEYSFIDEINPSGGNNAKVESTGIITRFTLSQTNAATAHLIKVNNLSVVDIILLLANAYYNNIKIDQDTLLRYDQIDAELSKQSGLWSSRTVQHNIIDEDDIKDIAEYMHDVIGNPAASVNQSKFCSVASFIQNVPYDKWVDIFGLLWNQNEEISYMFGKLIAEYHKLDFNTEIYIPFDAVLRKNGTLLKIQWLDTVCGERNDIEEGELTTTDIYDGQGRLLVAGFDKGFLSALIAEIAMVLPQHIANERPFLKKMDLLDFPGARGKEEYKESEIHTVLPMLLRRGKVDYLFNKYSRSLRIGSVLFCFHNDQKASNIGGTINQWICENIGPTPEERTSMLHLTNGISPLFLVATKFNMELERAKNDMPGTADKLYEHWKRFNKVLPEIVDPDRWLEEWVVRGGLFKSGNFQNIYTLSDLYWAAKCGVFDGYSDGQVKSPEKSVHTFGDYPHYFDDLKNSFLQNEFVQKHFADPNWRWDEFATPNHDGSKAIIRDLDAIASVLDEARHEKYMKQLKQIKEEMFRVLSVYFEPEEEEAKNTKVKQIISDIKFSLALTVGERPETFGKIIDNLMIPVGDLRNIAYDIIVCRTDTPKDFAKVNFIRKMANINTSDSKDSAIEKLCRAFFCNKEELNAKLQERNCNIAEIVAGDADAPTTVAEVVVKHIIEYWNAFINQRTAGLEHLMPHADEIVFMMCALLKKHNVRKELSERIHRYCTVFSENEQPNVIADYTSLMLNNFVSSVGRSYLSDEAVADIQSKANKCGIEVDLSPEAWKEEHTQIPLLPTLQTLEEAVDITNVSTEKLMHLPLWGNFMLWQTLVNIGLLYSSDISTVDPVANAIVKELLDQCKSLYKA